MRGATGRPTFLSMSNTNGRGFSVFARDGRSVWYMTFLSAETRAWTQKATRYKLSDPLGKKKALREAEALAKEFYHAPDDNEAWSRWVKPHLQQRHKSQAKTLTRYLAAWDNIAEFFADKKIHRPAQLSYAHGLQYLTWRTAQKRHNGNFITRNTAIFEVKLMGGLMLEALRRGYILSNPIDRMGIPRDPPKEKRELLDTDIERIRAHVAKVEGGLPITQRWMSVSFEIAVHQGCRLMECGVPMADVDEQRRTIKFSGKGRDGKPRVFTTQLHGALVPLMQELRRAGAEHTCKMPRMAGKIWFFAFRKAGVEGASFHCTRVTVITRLARAGVPIQQAMRYVNHSSRAVHAIYQKLKPEDLSACTDVLRFSGPSSAQTTDAPPTMP